MNFKTTPFKHQLDEWTFSREAKARAIFWEQGTGKSKLTIDTAAWMYLKGLIDAVIVVAPNGVHLNWIEDELPTHLLDDIARNTFAHYYQTSKAYNKAHKAAIKALVNYRGLSWLAISYPGFMTKEGKAAVGSLFEHRKVLYVLDEAHNIKEPTAARTKSILKSAKYAPYRRLLTGTPIAQGAFDLYSQITFLDAKLWPRNGLASYTAYKTHFGVFEKTTWNPHAWNAETGERSGAYISTCVGYRRLNQLTEMIKDISSRVTKDQVLDLPQKLYTKRRFEMTPEQARLYNDLKNEFMTYVDSAGDAITQPEVYTPTSICSQCLGAGEIVDDGFIYPCPACSADFLTSEIASGTLVTAELAIVRLMRLQQITCGYLPTDDEEEPTHIIPGPNRRLEALVEVVEATHEKVIVWARFQLDITLIIKELTARGIKCVRYDGLVDDAERAEAKYLFKGERPRYDNGQFIGREPIPIAEQARVFVGNPAAGSTGLTLTEAKTVVYYSNSFKLVDRLQSEDRAHRIGQTNNVLYVDIIADGTVDEKIVESLKSKHSIAAEILQDKKGDWI